MRFSSFLSGYIILHRNKRDTTEHVSCQRQRTCGVFGLTVVNHALFGEDHEEPVHLEHAHSRCDHHRHLTSAVKVTVDVMFIENCTTDRAEFRQMWKRSTYQLSLLLCCEASRYTNRWMTSWWLRGNSPERQWSSVHKETHLSHTVNMHANAS